MASPWKNPLVPPVEKTSDARAGKYDKICHFVACISFVCYKKSIGSVIIYFTAKGQTGLKTNDNRIESIFKIADFYKTCCLARSTLSKFYYFISNVVINRAKYCQKCFASQQHLLINGVFYILQGFVAQKACSTSNHGRREGETPPEFWNLTFSYCILSNKGCFLSLEKEKWSFITFGSPGKFCMATSEPPLEKVLPTPMSEIVWFEFMRQAPGCTPHNLTAFVLLWRCNWWRCVQWKHLFYNFSFHGQIHPNIVTSEFMARPWGHLRSSATAFIFSQTFFAFACQRNTKRFWCLLIT